MPKISHCKTKIKTIVKYHCILTKRTIIKNRIKTNFWQKYGEIEMLMLCWWEYEMVQPLGKQFFRKLNIELLYDPAFLLLDIYPREMKTSVQLSLSRVWLFTTPWTTARQALLSITDSRSLPKLMSIELVMSSNHLILCHPLLLLPSIFFSIRVFSNESALCIRWPRY